MALLQRARRTRSAPSHVVGEGAMEHLADREVPLTHVLDRVTACADLELNQTEEVVVRVKRVGDATHVVDRRSARMSVLNHLPLNSVTGSEFSSFVRRRAV